MKKLTLTFPSLEELSSFAKRLTSGYLINTVNLTLTATIPEALTVIAVDEYSAQPEVCF